ncbi:MAG: efflux RND transporter periplasmic adaptor subunit [Prevotella sp.]|nr:efflux RND transporter periplasmic adaptor subunit [Prevotella sp.]
MISCASPSVKGWGRLLLAALAALVFIGMFVFLWQKSRPQPVVYEEFVPAVSDIRRTTVVTGKIEPRNEVNVKPQISGIITEILKEAGQMVSEGEIIAKVKVVPDMAQLSNAEARVRLSEINVRQAKTDFDREQVLFDKGLVSGEEYEKIKQAYDQAREEVTAAKDNLGVVRDGVSSSNASASSTLIRSTITGLILDIPVKVGNSVINSNTFNDGTTIATVANMNDLIFRGNIDETEVGRLVAGMPMQITIGALQGIAGVGDSTVSQGSASVLEASLEYISPKAVESNGANQFEIKAAVNLVEKGSISSLRAGYSANAEIVLAEALQVLTVPESAIEFSGDSTFVYVKSSTAEAGQGGADGGYERRHIVTGLSDGISIAVVSGLKPTETVRGPKVIASE